MSILKIGIIGDTQTGKTSLINVYTEVGFQESITSTIGIVDNIKKLKSSNNKIYKLKIIDTAGQEKYHSLALNIFKQCLGLILVYEIDKNETFENIKNKWIKEINESFQTKIPIVLVGNKKDLENERIISEEEGKKLAEENDFLFFETSAKTGENVNEIFQSLFEIIVKDFEKDIKNKKVEININLNSSTNNIVIIKKKSCC